MSNLELSEVRSVIELIANRLGGSGKLKKSTAKNVYEALISVGISNTKIPIKNGNEIPVCFINKGGEITINTKLAGYRSGKGNVINTDLDKIRRDIPKKFKLN